jgi:hypothetical protein
VITYTFLVSETIATGFVYVIHVASDPCYTMCFQVPTDPPDPKPQPQAPPSPNAKQQRRQSYAEIDPDLEIQLEPLPIQMSSTTDNDMWMKVKYSAADQRPQQPDSLKLGRRSSSSSSLTNVMTSASGSECYSNLATENTFYNPGGLYDPDMDYMNQDPEGLFHTYTNQDDLLQQVSRVVSRARPFACGRSGSRDYKQRAI